MARDLITPVKCTVESTKVCNLDSINSVLVTTANGMYVKTGGTSHIDGSRLLFVLMRASSKQKAGTAQIRVVSGSTSGKEDYQPGGYSTGRNLLVYNALATMQGSYKSRNYIFQVPETARWKDSNGYINLNFSTQLGRNGNASQNCFLGAIYLKP